MEKLITQFEHGSTELSEYKTYTQLRNRVCYYDYPNGNGVMLPYNESSLDKAQSLVDMPVVAKYCINENGEPDLLDHCVSVDEEGNFVFNTLAVGVHTDVSIEDDEVQLFDGRVVTAKCLFATQKIWNRFPNYVAAIKRLFEAGALHNSWEITSSAYEYKDNVKTLEEYVFEGNCMLGEKTMPAYGDASKVLDLSAYRGNPDLMIASALSQDLLDTDLNTNTSGKEDENLKVPQKKDEMTPEEISAQEVPAEEPIDGTDSADSASVKTDDEKVEPPEVSVEEDAAGGEELSAEDEGADPVEVPETSALTDYDIRRKLNEACRKALDTWCWVSFVFPEDHVVWVEYDGRESELNYKKFTYAIENDEVTVSEPEDVQLTVSVANINQEIAQKSEDLISAMSRVKELEAQVEELTNISDEYAQFMAQREQEQKDAKRAELLEYVSSFNCFSEDELNSEALTSKLDALDEVSLKCMVADKLASSLHNTTPAVETPASETASVKAELTMEEAQADPVSIVRKFLYN